MFGADILVVETVVAVEGVAGVEASIVVVEEESTAAADVAVYQGTIESDSLKGQWPLSTMAVVVGNVVEAPLRTDLCQVHCMAELLGRKLVTAAITLRVELDRLPPYTDVVGRGWIVCVVGVHLVRHPNC